MLLSRRRWTAAVLVLASCYAAWVGMLASSTTRLAVLATLAGIALTLVMWRPVAIAVVAVPSVWIIQRAPGIDVSFADVLVAAAAGLAFAAAIHKQLKPEARVLLWGFAAYLGLLLGSVAANHSVRSDLELVHRVFLVAGAILVGAWTVREGQQRHALRLVVVASAVGAVAAVIDSAAHSFAPAYPLWFHKNFVGSITATTLILLVAAPDELRLPRRWIHGLSLLIAVGLVATQSRGSVLAVTVGLLIWLVRAHPERRRRAAPIAVIALIGLLTFASISVHDQLGGPVKDEHSSIEQRFKVESATSQLWKDNPLTGVGLRFFDTPEFAGYQAPNNVLNEVLAEAGFPGLLGFLIFVACALTALAKGRSPLALAGLCVVAGRFAHGMVDIYWVAGTTTLPWLIAGMGLAQKDREGGVPENIDAEAHASEAKAV